MVELEDGVNDRGGTHWESDVILQSGSKGLGGGKSGSIKLGNIAVGGRGKRMDGG